MALKEEKWEDNVPGKFYVDEACIICSVCSDCAPNNFKMSEDGSHDICYKQPENDEVMRKLLTKKEGAVEIQPIEQTYDMGESTEFGHMFLPDRCEAGPIYMCLMKKM